MEILQDSLGNLKVYFTKKSKVRVVKEKCSIVKINTEDSKHIEPGIGSMVLNYVRMQG